MPSSLEHYRGAKEEDEVNVDEAFDAMFLIENGLLRRDPIHAQNMRSSESNVSSLRHCRVGLPSMGAFLRVKVPSAP